jgi:N-acetylglucosamine-6-phosphate deacetylase
MNISAFAIRGRVVTPDEVIPDAVVTIIGERIEAVASFAQWQSANAVVTAPQPVGTLLPGLVDIHCHGGGGYAFTTADITEMADAARHHHEFGTTTLLASLVTARPETLTEQIATLIPLVDDGTLAGIHVEGPFLSDVRCGAQDPAYLLEPDPALTAVLLEAGNGRVRVMTVAPELPGYAELAAQLRARGVIVAIGHTDADYAVVRDALRDDACLVTHLANGMAPLHHRRSGPVAAALVAAADGDAVVEVIGDGIHVDAGFVAMVFAAARGNVALVTDAMAAAGMPDGTYQLGPQSVTVEDSVARIANGSIAGGTSHLIEVLQRAVRESEVPLVYAVRAASTIPAAVLGIDGTCGSIRPGRYADIVVVDDDLELASVMRRGSWLS